MNINNYSGLKHLFGSYLHQDFVDEFPTAMDAVRAFANDEPPESVQTAANDISALLADERFFGSPESVLFELGSYYDSRSEGMAAIEWLQQVQQALRGMSAS